jgi:hypothetical protein
MGLIRKIASASTLGGVKYTSRREAETKEKLASARMIRAQEKQLKKQEAADKEDTLTAKWEPIVTAIEAGDATWEDLTKMQKLSMPVKYQLRCRAARRRGDE